MPPGPLHSAVNNEVNTTIIRRTSPDLIVRCQDPISINRHNHPQPDIAIVRGRSDRYRSSHPSPDDILLIIEVSDSSLEFDLNTKRHTYAKAEIEEYWVLNVNARELHVFVNPWDGDYTQHATYAATEEVACTTIASLKLRVSEMLPSA